MGSLSDIPAVLSRVPPELQVVFHTHFHVIPRFNKGDSLDGASTMVYLKSIGKLRERGQMKNGEDAGQRRK